MQCRGLCNEVCVNNQLPNDLYQFGQTVSNQNQPQAAPVNQQTQTVQHDIQPVQQNTHQSDSNMSSSSTNSPVSAEGSYNFVFKI